MTSPLSLPECYAEDIDVFIGAKSLSSGSPNVLFILHNTANWASKDQGWPDNLTQGQAQLTALRTVISGIKDVNVGVMLMTPSADQGGMMVFGIKPMTEAYRTSLLAWIDARYNNIGDVAWKGSGNANYGSLMFDAFKYFGGFTDPANANTNIAGSPLGRTAFGTERYAPVIPTSQVDSTAYTSDFVHYVPPTTISACGSNYIVLIGNGFPKADDTTLLPNVKGNTTPVEPNPLDTISPSGVKETFMGDEWARYLYLTDVNSTPGQQNIVTYTVDVYRNSQDLKQSQYLKNMAFAGGGTPYTATTIPDITAALQKILVEVQAVNTTFSSASIPVNSTNRAQGKNEVFVPLFRPDPDAKPRWFGNLKRYQLIESGGTLQLGDANNSLAVNLQTGFFTDCAASFWTTDSGSYWSNVLINPSPRSNCSGSTTDRFSDLPDGPTVEKGGVAEVIRKGNNPAVTNANPTWSPSRTILTTIKGGTSLSPFTSSISGLTEDLVRFTSGLDEKDEDGDGVKTESRPSLHGDTIHSRPLPVDYGTSGVTVYYGSNDGMLRAVNAANGRERWAFLAPEFFGDGRLLRLMNNEPLVSNYFSTTTGVSPTPLPKGYFFDGPIGLYQTANNDKVWIYPTMRRGGRMLYGLNVTNPASPQILWSAGCPNFVDDIGCTVNFSKIGQTWSRPVVASAVVGYTSRPVVVVGGGYDNCEDANTATPSCSQTKGNIVYILDAQSGNLIKSFATARSVVADVALVSTKTSGVIDLAYVVDTGGNVYRITFGDTTDAWTMTRVAYTNGSGRKFMNAPAILVAAPNRVYLALGSGDREKPLSTHYPYTGVVNRFYVYLDDFASTATDLDNDAAMMNVTANNDCNVASVLPTSTLKGWFMNLNQYGLGEQVVTTALIVGGMVTFNTHRPAPPVSNSCTTTLGEARGYWVNLFNGSGSIGVPGSCGGTRSGLFAGGGIAPSPVFATVPINGVPRFVVIGSVKRDGTRSTTMSPQSVSPTALAKRKTVYWKSSNPK